MKVLFLNHPTIGHLNPLLTIALELRDRGHQPHFFVPGIKGFDPRFNILRTASAVPDTIARHHLPVDVMLPPLAVLYKSLFVPFASGYKEFALVADLFTKGTKYYTEKILKLIDRIKPDVLVSDFAFIPAHIAAEVANIPCVVVYHSGLPFRGRGIPPFASGLSISGNHIEIGRHYEKMENAILTRMDKRLNVIRRKFGLPIFPSKMLRVPYSKWLNLVTSVESMEAPRDNLTDNTFYIGPCFANRKGQSDNSGFPFDRLKADAYKIYVSLGTVFNGKPKVFSKIMSAMEGTDCQVIVSAGGAYNSLIRHNVPRNTMLFPSVPQVDILPRMDLVIGHGGNNSIGETLAAGKPLIVLPVGGEQGDNASRIEYLKVGLRLDIKRFTVEEIRQTVERIRKDSTFSFRAKEIKAAIDRTDGPQTASDCIEWLNHTKRPLHRPPGFPLTVTKDDMAALTTSANLGH